VYFVRQAAAFQWNSYPYKKNDNRAFGSISSYLQNLTSVLFLLLLIINISLHYQKKKLVGLERGPLSLVSTTEELLDRKVAAPL
jgi:hypothetical protein